MNDVAAELSNSRIIAAYREHTPGSAELAKEANELFPSGITHDARNVAFAFDRFERSGHGREFIMHAAGLRPTGRASG